LNKSAFYTIEPPTDWGCHKESDRCSGNPGGSFRAKLQCAWMMDARGVCRVSSAAQRGSGPL